MGVYKNLTLKTIENYFSFYFFSDYSDYDTEGILANILGVCMVLFGSLVAFLATHGNYRRIEKSEEQLLLGDRSPRSPW